MVKAEKRIVDEIRRGNWLDVHGSHLQATGLSDAYVVFEEPNYDVVNPDDVKGIELSEEWLIKFGFENFSPGLYHIKIHAEQERFLETMLPSKKFWDLTITITKKHIELWIRAIHYVHELQNLYFALTGRELELTK